MVRVVTLPKASVLVSDGVVQVRPVFQGEALCARQANCLVLVLGGAYAIYHGGHPWEEWVIGKADIRGGYCRVQVADSSDLVVFVVAEAFGLLPRS